MHEISIAQDLIDLAVEQLELSGCAGQRVAAVHVRLGALAGVIPQALQSAWTSAIRGTPLRGARLVVEHVPAAIWCGRCEARRELQSSTALRRCPACDAPAAELLAGLELELSALHVDPEGEPGMSHRG